MGDSSDQITSTQNAMIVSIRSLHRRKARREQGAFLVEGVRTVREALVARAACRFLVYCPEMLGSNLSDFEALVPMSSANTRLLNVSPSVMQSLTDTESPQGVIAVVVRGDAGLPPLDVANALVLILDGVRDPGNVGTLLRTAAAADCTAVVTTVGTADVFAPKVVRAGMGAHFMLPIVAERDWQTLGPQLGSLDSIYGAVADGAVRYDTADWTRGSAIVIGNEDRGLSDDAMQWCRALVTIPMAPGVESLNAAIAGAVLLFEAARQRRRNVRRA